MKLIKQMPNSLELEIQVLGALIINGKLGNKVFDRLVEKDFYHPKHKKIFRAIKTLFTKSEPIDLVTVVEQLKKQNDLQDVEYTYLGVLTDQIATSTNIENHVLLLKQKTISRELIEKCQITINKAYDPTIDPLELLSETEKQISRIADNNIKRDFINASTLMIKSLDEIQNAQNGNAIGINSGLQAFDELTSGFSNTDLIIVAARPGMGKTAFALTVARNAAVDFKKRVGVISLEMSATQLGKRLISIQSGISNENIKNGSLNENMWKSVTDSADVIGDANIWIDDTAGTTIFEIKAKSRKLKQKYHIDLIIIDYLQLINATEKGLNREQQVSKISRTCKEIAKELNIPIILLSQLSRAVENRDNKRPLLSDLRESGAIEQDADQVIFIYRPEYYGITKSAEGTPLNNLAEIILAKNRNGKTDFVITKFIPHLTKFENINTM